MLAEKDPVMDDMPVKNTSITKIINIIITETMKQDTS
jgi:hypothetical protein